ncbi:MAG: SIMPL domain-containing protein [Candidatus Limnocylindrales bacterium]
MDRRSTPTLFSTRATMGLLIPLLVILIGGCAAAGSPSASAPVTTRAAAPTGESAPGALPMDPTGGGTSGAPSAGSGTASGAPNTAVAYPYPVFGGSAGLAPDHELVVSGTGWADVKADLSDRAAAQRTALAAAIADAKSQAEAAATDAGVTLGGVISMSVSVGGNYVMPMGVESGPPTEPSTGVPTPVPPSGGGSAPSAPPTEQLEVTVTVAYTIS